MKQDIRYAARTLRKSLAFALTAVLSPSILNSPLLSMFGRLQPQVSMEQANAEFSVFNRRYASAHPEMLDTKPGSPSTLTPLKD
jgi:hypothetical protein